MQMTSVKPKIVCLTPIKNEEWILETFLKCASVWADHIIVADQMSTDSSREIVSRFEKAILVDNDSPVFNEPERVQLLLREAREIPGPKIFIALDADEILAGDLGFMRSSKFLSLAPGTKISFDWLNVEPSCRRYWSRNPPMFWGFVDDGSPYQGEKIHSERIPASNATSTYHVGPVHVLHLQYIDWDRMKSKHRWYQCYERVHFPEKSPISIYRMYHHMDSLSGMRHGLVTEDSIRPYTQLGIDPFSHAKESIYRWDREVADMIRDYGVVKFRFTDIWECDWLLSASEVGDFPKSRLGKIMLWYLKVSQSNCKKIAIRAFDRLLDVIFKSIHVSGWSGS